MSRICTFCLSLAVCLWTGGARAEESSAQRQASASSGHLLVIRVSQAAFDSLVSNNIDVTADVDEVILETRARGRSRTQGTIAVDIAPNHENASFVLTFAGQTHSRTTGRNGPAIIHSRSATQFTCQKQVVFDLQRGFHAGPTTIRAHTDLVIEDVASTSRGLRGLVVRRVAWNRIRENFAAAHRESAALARRDIVNGFDETIAHRLTELNQRLAVSELARLLGNATETEYTVSSTSNCIQLAVRRQGSADIPVSIPDRQVAEGALEVWVHASLLAPETFESFRLAASVRQLMEPVLTFINERSRWLPNGLRLVRNVTDWQTRQTPFRSRLATRAWLRSRPALPNLTAAEDWIVFSVRELNVARRLARAGNLQPVSAEEP